MLSIYINDKTLFILSSLKALIYTKQKAKEKSLRHKRIDKSANFIWFSFEWSIRTKVFSFFKVCFFKLCMQLSFNFFAPEDQSRLNQIFRNIHISYNLLYQLKCLIFRSNYMVFINSRTIITSRSEYRDA